MHSINARNLLLQRAVFLLRQPFVICFRLLEEFDSAFSASNLTYNIFLRFYVLRKKTAYLEQDII